MPPPGSSYYFSTPEFGRADSPDTDTVQWVSPPPSPQRKWRQGYRGRASPGGAPQILRRPPSSPAGRSPAPWPPPCRRKSLPVGGGMCVSFCVIDLIAPVSDAEQIPMRALGLGLSSLINGVLKPMVTSSIAVLQSIGLGSLPLHLSHTGPQKAPRLPTRGTGTTPASAICLELLRVAVRLHAGLGQRR